MDFAEISVRSANARVIESLAGNSHYRMGGGRARSQSRPLNAIPQSRERLARDKRIVQGSASLDSNVGEGVSAVQVGPFPGLGAAGAWRGQDMAMADRNMPALPRQRRPSSSTVRSWANVAKSAATKILEAADSLWKGSLVGYFVGKKLPFKLVETALKHLWGHQLKEVKANDQGFYFFHIPDHEFRRKVVEGGPLTVARVPLILQQWLPKLELRKRIHTAVPVWIRLKNLPYALWTAPGLSAVASQVGKPLYVDQRTEQLKLISYAQVCVEITATNDYCESLKIDLNGEPRMVEVEYKWKPISCKIYGTFGHKCPVQAPSQVERAAAPQVAVEPLTVVDCIAAGIAAEKDAPTTSFVAKECSSLASLPAEAAVLHARTRKLEAARTPAAVTGVRMADGAGTLAGLARPPLVLTSDQVADARVDAVPKRTSTDVASFGPSSVVADDIQASPLMETDVDTCSVTQSSPRSMEIAAIDLYIQVPRVNTQVAIPGAVRGPPLADLVVAEGWQQVKGLIDPIRQSEVRNFVKSNHICCVGLIETKLPPPRFRTISSGLLPGWTWIANNDYAARGRIWIGWNSLLVDINVLFMTSQIIHVSLITLSYGASLTLSVVYGEHSFVARRPLWNDLTRLSSSLKDCPWIVAGVNRKQRKIDRVLVNNSWCTMFSYSEASFLAPGISDHTPMVVRILAPNPRRSPFKFFNMWMNHPDFSMIVSQVWQTHLRGSPTFKLYGRLKLLKCHLKILNREVFSAISTRTSEAKQALITSQEALLLDPFNRELVDLEHL
ncbi:hypothetical protein BT93_K0422 [Corymbia citriodora subsp. variegata]|nr:hypothetical protein BT93_K0422 [Corymbia citriodora subsp. variegata]